MVGNFRLGSNDFPAGARNRRKANLKIKTHNFGFFLDPIFVLLKLTYIMFTKGGRRATVPIFKTAVKQMFLYIPILIW